MFRIILLKFEKTKEIHKDIFYVTLLKKTRDSMYKFKKIYSFDGENLQLK